MDFPKVCIEIHSESEAVLLNQIKDGNRSNILTFLDGQLALPQRLHHRLDFQDSAYGPDI